MQKVDGTMRSLYRLKSFQEFEYTPQIIIDLEKNIFEKRFQELNDEEINYMDGKIQSYCKEQEIIDRFEGEVALNQIKHYLNELN